MFIVSNINEIQNQWNSIKTIFENETEAPIKVTTTINLAYYSKSLVRLLHTEIQVIKNDIVEYSLLLDNIIETIRLAFKEHLKINYNKEQMLHYLL